MGRFVVLRRLGAGSMGVVYSAYDEELGRRVAIKLIHVDGRAGQRQARLQREAQVMARLSHPNVVQVYEVGEHDGHIYIAMEYIAGRTLAAWLAEARRGWPDVLAVFLQVGAGLAAAHRAALVHRDVKPDNILIGEDGRALIADFGLARHDSHAADAAPSAAADQALDDDNLRLTATHALIGTPAYMPPEQHLGRAVDARSDQYSFCASLWESVHGELPFTAATRGELILKITGGSLPPWRRGGRVPRWLHRTIARGLAADPAARWDSMDALLAALGRATWRRRRWLIVAVGFGALLGTAVNLAVQRTLSGARACEDAAHAFAGVWGEPERAAVASALLATRSSHAPDTAERVAAGLDRYAERWRSTHRAACGDEASTLAHHKLACLERQRQEARALVQVLAGADATIAEHAVFAVASLPDPAECTDPARLARSDADAPAERGQLAALEQRLATARALGRAGDYQRALDTAMAALVLARQTGHGSHRAQAQLLQGELLEHLGKLSAAEHALVDAYWTAEAHADDDTKLAAATRLIGVDEQQTRLSEAHVWARGSQAIVARTRLHTGRHADLHDALGSLAIAENDLDAARASHEAALELRRRLFDDSHPDVARSLNNLGVVHDMQGQSERALEYYQRAVALQERVLGERHPSLASPLYNIGVIHYNLRAYEPASAAFQRALQINQANLGGEHPTAAMTMLGLAEVHRSTGRHALAEQYNQQALALAERTLGPDHPLCAYALVNLGRVLLETDRPQQAIPRFERALKIQAASRAAAHELAEAHEALARAHWQHDADRTAAVHHARTAVAEFRRATPPREQDAARVEAWIAGLE
ncbi:MAG: tetratricopeptide repeat protein [Myxococcales bacterium]|nr:tetratricopeptide repeat protein [Myxococcales bacterium]